MRASNSSLTLQRYFAGITEAVFQTQLGIANPPVIDYVSDLLSRFVRVDALYRVRDLTGRPVTEVAEMLEEAGYRVGAARRAVHRHIGDFALFWTGVYPEALGKLQSSTRKDHFIDYCTQGKRAYLIASAIESDDDEGAPPQILEELGRLFEMYAYGLREVRREWERRDDYEAPGPLLIN